MTLLLDLKKQKCTNCCYKIVPKYKNLAKKKAALPFNISDVPDAEKIDYNKDTNINDVLSSKSAQIAAKKIINKCNNLRKKRKSTLDTSQLDVVPSSKKNKATSPTSRNINVQIAAKKNRKIQKNITKKDPFSDVSIKAHK